MGGDAELSGPRFFDRVQEVLIIDDFDAFAEALCAPHYAPRMGAPSIPPDRYFRTHLIGYFEGIDSEHGIEWRCADSLSLREFLRLGEWERVPDHSWLSKTRGRLPHKAHAEVFGWLLARLAEHGLVQADRIDVDASTMEANVPLRTIVRRDSGEGYREMLDPMAEESGIATPSAEDLVRMDRARKGKKLSSADWVSKTDPEAKIAKMKDGTSNVVLIAIITSFPQPFKKPTSSTACQAHVRFSCFFGSLTARLMAELFVLNYHMAKTLLENSCPWNSAWSRMSSGCLVRS